MREYLRQSDFQVFFRDITLANKAGFPTKLSESISSGVPAITTELSGIVRYLDAPFIFSCETGGENDILDYCIKLTRVEKNKLRDMAYKSNLFYFANYRKRAIKFFKQLGFDESYTNC